VSSSSRRHGVLVVFEGAEGVGKTTQVRKLVEWLEHAGLAYQYFREPGGTSIGEAIRQLLLEPGGQLADATEALLFLASRAQLVHDNIRPALDRGDVVVLDRFFLSTYAYQIVGRGLGETDIRYSNRLAVGDIVPDVTFLLNLPFETGLQRAGHRGPHDRMELAGNVFHERVSAAFASFLLPEWQEHHPECGPILPVDAAGTEDDVFRRIVNQLLHRFPERFASAAD